MAYSAPYSQGTISLDTENPRLIIGNGTLWTTIGLVNDKIQCAGLAVSVQEIVDDTHALIYYDWPGAAFTDSAYFWEFESELRGTTADLTSVVRDRATRLRVFDKAVPIFSVKQFGVNTPPGDAVVGDFFVVGSAGMSSFAGHNNEIAEKTETGYLFTIPVHGYHSIDEEQNLVRSWNGTSWSSGIGLGASIQFAKDWNADDPFKVGNVVTHADRVWIANANNTNSEPATGNTDWSILLEVGEDGGAFTLSYSFVSDVDNNTPGPGGLKFNNTAGSANVIRVSKTDAYGNDWGVLLAYINTATTSVQKGKVRVATKGDKTRQVIATVMTSTLVESEDGDYYNLTISSPVVSVNALVGGAPILFMFSERGDKGATGDKGDQGDKGWSPSFSLATDGDRRVLKIIDWVGGAGTKPAANKYVGLTGLVDALADGLDVRGLQGLTGATGAQGQGIQPDASGPLANRSAHDAASEGFIYLSTDETPNMIYVMGAGGAGDWSAGSPTGGGLQSGNNLSDLENFAEARDNLELGDLATKNESELSNPFAAAMILGG